MSETMNDKYEKIEQQLSDFKTNFRETMQNYPADIRKELLANLVEQLCASTLAHVKLILAEKDGRFLISENDYHKLLDGYWTMFNEIKTLPRARPKSIYEIRLISSLDTIIKSHCQGEEVE